MPSFRFAIVAFRLFSYAIVSYSVFLPMCLISFCIIVLCAIQVFDILCHSRYLEQTPLESLKVLCLLILWCCFVLLKILSLIPFGIELLWFFLPKRLRWSCSTFAWGVSSRDWPSKEMHPGFPRKELSEHQYTKFSREKHVEKMC